MPKIPDRRILSDFVDAYDRIFDESLGMGDPEFHEMEDELREAIVESPYRAVIKNGNIYVPRPNGFSWELIMVDPAEPENLDDPEVLNLDESCVGRICTRGMWLRNL